MRILEIAAQYSYHIRRLFQSEKFDLLGTALFAYVGTIAGGKNGMDMFVYRYRCGSRRPSGGTLRHCIRRRAAGLLDGDVTYLKICIWFASLVTFFTAAAVRDGRDWRDARLHVAPDARGMGAFARRLREDAVKDVDPPTWRFRTDAGPFGGVTRGRPHETSREDLPRDD